jgi:hypothetical protein
LLEQSGLGFGLIAAAGLMEAERKGTLGKTHFPAQAQAVIQLMQNGGPSQMDLFDPKPELQKNDGKRYSLKVETFQTGSETNELLGSPFEFKPRGQCGMQLSNALTHTPEIADDICLIRSMQSGHNNHTEALVMLETGKIFRGRPTLGSWITYALGSENQDLPAYIVLRDPEGYSTCGSLLWESAWLPANHRGTEFNTKGTPMLNLHPSRPATPGVQEQQIAFITRMNEEHRRDYLDDSRLEARIRNYELAARMQLRAENILSFQNESEVTRRLYGLDNPVTAGYGTRCLMARRLVEAGVRFVQVFPPVKPNFQPWDSHTNSRSEIEAIACQTEQPAVALVKDLKSRGLLDRTIVLWTGEFGRLPISQNGRGRDHNRYAFSIWVSGGGFKRGFVYGATDEVGYKAIEKPMSVANLHATILNQLGLDHRKLSFHHAGRDETLTDFPVTGAYVVEEVLQAPVSAEVKGG